jgi:hypothetical protein
MNIEFPERRRAMIKAKDFLRLAVVVSVVAARAGATELEGATVDAWQEYLPRW